MIYMHDVSGEGKRGFQTSSAAAWKAGLPDKHRKTRFKLSVAKKKLGAPVGSWPCFFKKGGGWDPLARVAFCWVFDLAAFGRAEVKKHRFFFWGKSNQ